jgi:hypothetical protein
MFLNAGATAREGILGAFSEDRQNWGYNEDSELVLVLTGHIKLETYNGVEKYFIDIITYIVTSRRGRVR